MSSEKTYNLNNWKEAIFDFLTPLREFIQKEKFYSPTLGSFEEQLNIRHPDWIDQNKIIVSEFNDLVENNLEKSLDIIKGGLLNVEEIYSLNRLQLFNHKKLPSPGEQIKELAGAYEHLDQLKFISYLLSQKRIDIGNLKKQEQILKYLKVLGLSSNEVNLFRLLRNANNHKIYFKDNKCILDENNEITIEEIGILYEKIKSYFKYIKSVLLCSLLNIPRFTLYTLIIFLNTQEEFNKKHEDIGKSFSSFYPNLLEDKDTQQNNISNRESIISKLLNRILKRKQSHAKSTKVSPVHDKEKIITLCKFIAQSKIEIQKMLSIDNSEYKIYMLNAEKFVDTIFEATKDELLK